MTRDHWESGNVQGGKGFKNAMECSRMVFYRRFVPYLLAS